MERILVVDDDTSVLDTVGAYLTKNGYAVSLAKTVEDALKIASSTALDCIILDVDLPDGSGLSVCEELRRISLVPIIFLSAYNREDDRIRGLISGGDDYMGKPYSLMELALRVRVRIDRRRGREQTGILRFGSLEIDSGLHEVRYGDRVSEFSRLEFDLLLFLARHPRQVFSYEQLYDRVWNEPMNRGLHNLQMCVARVRQKLEELCPDHSYIETIRRKGYRFVGDKSEDGDEDAEFSPFSFQKTGLIIILDLSL